MLYNIVHNYNLHNYVCKHHKCWWKQQYKDCKSLKEQVKTEPWTHASYMYNKNGEKTMQCRFTLGKQQVCTCITLFHTFYCYHYTCNYMYPTKLPKIIVWRFTLLWLYIWTTQDKNFLFVSLNLDTCTCTVLEISTREKLVNMHLANCTKWWFLKQNKFTS